MLSVQLLVRFFRPLCPPPNLFYLLIIAFKPPFYLLIILPLSLQLSPLPAHYLSIHPSLPAYYPFIQPPLLACYLSIQPPLPDLYAST